jgi:hypothetical protein
MSILEISNRVRKHKGQLRLRGLDVNEALTSRRIAPLLGYAGSDSPRRIAIGHCAGRDLLAFDDRQIPLSEFRGAPLRLYRPSPCSTSTGSR